MISLLFLKIKRSSNLQLSVCPRTKTYCCSNDNMTQHNINIKRQRDFLIQNHEFRTISTIKKQWYFEGYTSTTCFTKTAESSAVKTVRLVFLITPILTITFFLNSPSILPASSKKEIQVQENKNEMKLSSISTQNDLEEIVK